MRWFLAFMLFAFPAFADDSHPEQWQWEESLEVPSGPIPRDRCIRALYLTEELREERGVPNGEGWYPPIDNETAFWLEEQRRNGVASLTFCDSEERT